MSALFESTDTGLKLNDTQEVLDAVKDVFKRAFPNLDVDTPSSPQGQIINGITEQLAQARDVVALYTSMMVNGGFGTFLDYYMSTLYGIHRQEARPMLVEATIKGAAGTFIDEGFKAQSGTFVFDIDKAATIGADGSVKVGFTSEAVGANQIEANTLTQINTPIMGVESITNEAASFGAGNMETDAELYQRGQSSLFNRAIVVFGAMVARVQDVRGVARIGNYENYTNEAVTYRGVEVAPHSVALVIEGGQDSDIAAAMLATKNPGCGLVGDVEYTITIDDIRQDYTMRWFRPVAKDLSATIKVKIATGVDANYKDILSDNLIELIGTKPIGSTIYPLQVLNAITPIQHLLLEEFTLQKAGVNEAPTTPNEPIELGFKEAARLQRINIVITHEDEATPAYFESDLDKAIKRVNADLDKEVQARIKGDNDLKANIDDNAKAQAQTNDLLTAAVNSNEAASKKLATDMVRNDKWLNDHDEVESSSGSSGGNHSNGNGGGGHHSGAGGL